MCNIVHCAIFKDAVEARLSAMIAIEMTTLPKAQRTRGLSLYHKFKQKSWPNFISRISTKHQLQNHNETSASPRKLSFKILVKLSFRISTKIQLHNLYKTSAEKNWPNSSFTSCLDFEICKNCCQHESRSSSATVTKSTSFELESLHARVTSIKFTKQESFS